MRISDWSSDVCSSDLGTGQILIALPPDDLAGAGVRRAADRSRLNAPPPRQGNVISIDVGCDGVQTSPTPALLCQAGQSQMASPPSSSCHSGSRFAPDSAGNRYGQPRHPDPISRPAPKEASTEERRVGTEGSSTW